MADDNLPLLEDESDSDDDTDNMQEVDIEEELGRINVAADEGNGNQVLQLARPRRQSHTEVTFNVQLPVAHSYLGEDLEELYGRTIHDDDSCQSLPIVSLPGVVLIPGQTIPLHLFSQSTVRMIKHALQNDRIFGLVCKSFIGHGYHNIDHVHSKYGTTAEIFSIKEENDDRTGITNIRMKATGRQRFEIMETRHQVDGTLFAKVRILSERVLPECLEGARCLSHSKTSFSVPHWCPTNQDEKDIEIYNNCFNIQKRRRLNAAYSTCWPAFVYENYDAQCLMKKMKEMLFSWNDTLDADTMPDDPVDFSFWVASNLMMDDELKLKLLQIDCAIQRLRCELGIMKKCSVLCCKECEEVICHMSDVFTMSIQGPMGTFVNPGGYVHEMFTINDVRGVNLIGRPSKEHSWFPGYAWTICQCENCSSHMGWRFTVVNKKRGLKPEKFFGICRSALIPKLQQDADNDSADNTWEPCL